MDSVMSALDEQRERLESAFFCSDEQHLADRIRLERDDSDELLDAEEFARLFDFTDPGSAEWIAGAHRRRESLACLVLAPVLAVAWADRHLSSEERGVILDTAAEFGIAEGTPAFNLLSQWLENRGVRRLADAWVGYVRLLCDQLTDLDRSSLRKSLLKNAERAAAHESLELSPFSWLRRSRILRRLKAAFESD